MAPALELAEQHKMLPQLLVLPRLARQVGILLRAGRRLAGRSGSCEEGRAGHHVQNKEQLPATAYRCSKRQQQKFQPLAKCAPFQFRSPYRIPIARSTQSQSRSRDLNCPSITKHTLLPPSQSHLHVVLEIEAAGAAGVGVHHALRAQCPLL